MKTAEMWVKAEEDGRVYKCVSWWLVDSNILYSKSTGLIQIDRNKCVNRMLNLDNCTAGHSFDEEMSLEWSLCCFE